MAGDRETWIVIAEDELTFTVLNPWQFETGQCCVITRRHVATLLELDAQEGNAVIAAAQRVANAMLAAGITSITVLLSFYALKRYEPTDAQ